MRNWTKEILIDWIQTVITENGGDKDRFWQTFPEDDTITIFYRTHNIIDKNPDPTWQNDYIRTNSVSININVDEEDDTEEYVYNKIVELVKEVEQIPLITEK